MRSSAAAKSEVAVRRAIRRAEALLPGAPAPEGKPDRRWMAMIEIANFIQTQPEAVWQFVLRWGKHPQADLRAGVSACLLEHLLEHHFDLIFPRVRQVAMKSPRFAQTFSHCMRFGQAEFPRNAARMGRLKRDVRRQAN